ncbi:S1/P1 nuclease [Sphingomonas pseudosanguinis]|uniref:S1/P1 nuclease n=1 Tax=Sphingomonas pseudosanguinis TaxID=413712 RepID=UPI003F845588
MKHLRLFAALIAASLLPSPAAAYWEYGHETVAAIAWANITPHARTEIRRILRAQAQLDTPTCPVRTIEEASVWPDCVKPLKDDAGKSRFGYAYSWHYQNVDICQPFRLPPACDSGDCVSAQIPRQLAILKDKRASEKDRVMALAFLVHFVGDLHQPLHAGDKGDKGGNDTRVDYGIYATPRLNLHSVWDGLLAERAISTPPKLVRRYPLAEQRREATGGVMAWSRENWVIAKRAYAAAMGGDACRPTPALMQMDEAAIQAMAPVEREQIKRGGLRLAKLLNGAFRG